MLENNYILSAADCKYRIIDMIGKGANTTAYFAECLRNGLSAKCILKEYTPQNTIDFEKGKERFIASGKTENEIRQNSVLLNQTPPINSIFEANGTAFIEVSCYNGVTLDNLNNLTLPQYIEICRTITKTVSYYHKLGYLCLDLKPENIFIMQNTDDDTITQIVEFIDFDSIRKITDCSDNKVFSYTREWASPEQLNPFSIEKIGISSDIYTLGELIFYLLFDRHSTQSEHRGFSKYPFEEVKKDYRKYISRPDIQSLFSRIFRGTIRSSASNRFQNIDQLIKLLDLLVTELERKDYVVPILPSISPDFIGRDNELKCIADNLKKNPVLYITGVGGIGKSTLIKNYIFRHRADYDIIVYLEFDRDFQHTFCDDMQLMMSNISKEEGEELSEYFKRKLAYFKRICNEKRTLFIIDNYSGKIERCLSCIFDCGYDTVIVTRNKPPKNSFPFIEVNAISDLSDIFKLIVLNLERAPTKEERKCFEEITELVQGHTLVIELITRQISAGKIDVHSALDLIRNNGFSKFSQNKISNYKDGEEVYDTLSSIISALFKAINMTEEEQLVMKISTLLDFRGFEKNLFQIFFPVAKEEIIEKLSDEGWLYADNRIRLHPVIAETIRNWKWFAEDISVMEYHKTMIDIYVGMANAVHISEILRDAEIFRNNNPRHIINAMYYDMVGFYYDTLLNGNYFPDNDEDAENLKKLLDSVDSSISEIKESTDIHRNYYLIQYYISLANILMRGTPDNYDEAEGLLEIAGELLEKETDITRNNCYFFMSLALYYTYIVPEVNKMKKYTKQAKQIAKGLFPTDLELIDIIYIPTANSYFNFNDFNSAKDLIEEAVEICKKYPDSIPYIDKKAELMNCLLDIYMELHNIPKCKKLISEIDHINNNYNDKGICRRVNPVIREKAD